MVAEDVRGVRTQMAEDHTDGFYTPTEAALILRVTPTRVRQLLQDGELEGERDEAGHWLIPARSVHERLERLRRESLLEAVGYDLSSIREMPDLVEVLREQVEMLRVELEEAHAANREHRRIIAALTQRIPAIEPPQEAPPGPRESPVTDESEAARGTPPEAAPGAQEAAQPRPWWRRMFGD